jgi:hypothetical protein
MAFSRSSIALDKRKPGAWVVLMAQRVVDDGIDSETRLFLSADDVEHFQFFSIAECRYRSKQVVSVRA